jgi:hypothetical protein
MLAIAFQEFPNTVAIQAGDEEFVKLVAIPTLAGSERFGHKPETNEMLAITFQEFSTCSNTWGDEEFVRLVAIPTFTSSE